jgi:hypothetical protein
LALSPQKHWGNGSVRSRNSRRIEKVPVLFPVRREFWNGDGFDCDCVRHHPVRISIEFLRLAECASPWRPFSSGLVVSTSPACPTGPNSRRCLQARNSRSSYGQEFNCAAITLRLRQGTGHHAAVRPIAMSSLHPAPRCPRRRRPANAALARPSALNRDGGSTTGNNRGRSID